MPKINFDEILLDRFGEHAKSPDEKSVTLADVATAALLEGDPEKKTKDKNNKHFATFVKIVNRDKTLGVVDIDNGEAEEIERLIGSYYAPLVSGQASALLNGRANPLKKTD